MPTIFFKHKFSIFSMIQLLADGDEVELHYQIQRDRILKSTPNPFVAKYKITRLFIWEIIILTVLWQPIAQSKAWKILQPLSLNLGKNLESSFYFLTRR